MISPVHTIDPDASLSKAARRMRDENVGSLPVGMRDELLGIITDRDIVVRCIADDMDCNRTTVRTVMSADLLCCFDDQPVEVAAQLMEEHRVRRLPVLNQNDRLAGILSLDDLTGWLNRNTEVHRVVFYREVATSGPGGAHKVPLAIVHITRSHNREEIEALAIAQFERDHGGRSWHHLAQGYDVIESS
ncbi:MAG: CBS domain-containing protein [Hyphomicrobiales bacterium]